MWIKYKTMNFYKYFFYLILFFFLFLNLHLRKCIIQHALKNHNDFSPEKTSVNKFHSGLVFNLCPHLQNNYFQPEWRNKYYIKVYLIFSITHSSKFHKMNFRNWFPVIFNVVLLIHIQQTFIFIDLLHYLSLIFAF